MADNVYDSALGSLSWADGEYSGKLSVVGIGMIDIAVVPDDPSTKCLESAIALAAGAAKEISQERMHKLAQAACDEVRDATNEDGWCGRGVSPEMLRLREVAFMSQTISVTWSILDAEVGAAVLSACCGYDWAFREVERFGPSS